MIYLVMNSIFFFFVFEIGIHDTAYILTICLTICQCDIYKLGTFSMHFSDFLLVNFTIVLRVF